MRARHVYLLFAIIISIQIGVRSDDFRPTPIPVDDWNNGKHSGEADTLTETPPIIAAVPAHYWEDALRHSVYLTIVRDKIDQLIAKGDAASQKDKPETSVSKEVDDHDLWDKIKRAPFDRIEIDEANSSEDVTIMAKGRVLENNNEYRFTQDERTKEKCSDEKCAAGVKAFWSVKRVRQRDQDTSSGKYNYELTFSVISQVPKKQKKSYENSIRTFTVKETTPDKIEDFPHEHRRIEPSRNHTPRPQRAIWVHKNIVPVQHYSRRHHRTGLQRIFSSLFSDYGDNSHEKQPRHRNHPPPPHPQHGAQYPKNGPVGVEQQYHTKLGPYPYKPHNIKYSRPQLPPIPPGGPHQHHFLDYDSSPIVNGHPDPTQDNRIASSQTIKTTRPALLPTPIPSASMQKEPTFTLGNFVNVESAEKGNENVTRIQEPINSHKNINKPRPIPVKVNFFPEHIRPPVYNAPPGVFATMDKKPFKPLPPLKISYNSKPQRPHRPTDFRPSPQVHDSQSPITDPLFDLAFRPITVSYIDSSTIEQNYTSNIVKKGHNKIRKTNVKKPPKKHDGEKRDRITTATPDIITVQSPYEGEIETIDWVNVLGAFTKTTPMDHQTEKTNYIETTTIPSTTETAATTDSDTDWKIFTTTETAALTTPIPPTTTTVKPKKRTRPPPKFTKQDKIRKHKRITTIPTTTTTSTTTTTNAPERPIVKRPLTDVTTYPSSINDGRRSFFEINNKTIATPSTTTTSTTRTTTTISTTKPTTTSTTLTPRPTTTRSTTTALPRETLITTTNAPTTTTKSYNINYPRNRNRFRQSTLLYKGTSVKHDKWSNSRNQTNTSPTSTVSHRRLTSNFQGYASTKPTYTQEELTDNKDIIFDLTSSERDLTLQNNYSTTYNDNNNNVLPLDKIYKQDINYSEDDEPFKSNETEEEEDTRDQSEYIFDSSTTVSDASNEVAALEDVTMPAEVIPLHEVSKNKTKCKKKHNATSTEHYGHSMATTSSSETSSMDIFEELFGMNFGETSTTTKEPELKEEASSNHESYLKMDDLEDFMDELNDKNKYSSLEANSSEQEYDNDDGDDDENNERDNNETDDDDSNISDDDDKEETSRHSRQESYNLRHPFSFLELMAME